jgi:acyl transferase domain-containing protein/aryl carrier-like protein
VPASAPAAGPAAVAAPVLAALRQTLVQIAAEVLKMRPADLAGDADLAHYGFDSISIAQFTRRVGERYRVPLTPAVFFEHGTINSFGDHLVATHRADVESAHADAIETRRAPAAALPAVQAPSVRGLRQSRAAAPTTTTRAAAAEAAAAVVEDVAIIGMSGVFPQSADLERYWQHLEGAHDLISPVPEGRFDQAQHGGTPVAWCGGFMPDVDSFDAAFFNISPREATLMDPQQRLLLQTVWRTIEDAGYKPSQLASTSTGLFVGVASYDYGDLVDASGKDVEAYTVTGIAHSVLANRVSYFFNLRGPSEPINTACSSSLVAIHRAVTAIRQGECSMAIAGGVNVLCSPKLFLSFAKAGMLSPDGRCRTFDSTANGYVRGEGVGALLLKPLSRALADGDHVYAVVKGSAVNHGGHVHSLTVPNPNAQADLLIDAYKRAHVDIDTVTYIEAHGTGTALGDPIEINGLKKAFAAMTPSGAAPAPATCGVGSVKTNVGHLEAAAGIAGVIKVLLAMRHGTLPASLHCNELNPYIDLTGSPFYIVDKTMPWKRKATADGAELPRRAGVSSFGFAGTNAHVVLEEFAPATRPVTATAPGERLLALSAKTADELRASAQQLLAFLQSNRDASDLPIDLADVAYTLLAGRDEMDVRLAVVAGNAGQAIDALRAFASGESHDRVFTGTARRPDATDAAGAAVDADAVRELVRHRGLAAAAALWVGQRGVDLAGLLAASGRRLALPTYPFGGKRYWISSAAEPAAAVVSRPIVDRVGAAGGAAQSRTAFSSADALVADHLVNGAATLPGVAYLEMALQTAAAAGRQAVPRLRNIIWSHPFTVGADSRELRVDVNPRAGALQFTATSDDGAGETVHCTGELIPAEPASTDQAVPQVDTAAVSARCSRHLPHPAVYAAFSSRGLVYGPTYQGIARLQASDDEAFATIAAAPSSAPAGCTLPPFVCDAALQATMAFLPEHDRDRVLVPFALGELEILGSIGRTRYVHVTKTDLDLERGSATFDINLLDETGRMTARLRDFNARAFGAPRQAPAAAADLDDAAVEALLQAVATGELSIEDAGRRLPF